MEIWAQIIQTSDQKGFWKKKTFSKVSKIHLVI